MNPIKFTFIFAVLGLLTLASLGYSFSQLWDGKLAEGFTAFMAALCAAAVLGDVIQQEKRGTPKQVLCEGK